MFFRLNIVRATPAGGHKLAGLRKVFGKEEPSTGRVPPVLSLPVQGGQGGRRTRDHPPTHGRNSSCTGLTGRVARTRPASVDGMRRDRIVHIPELVHTTPCTPPYGLS